MARPKSGEKKTSRADILKLTDALIRAHGYKGFSYLDLARELGVAKPTLHHYFATKADLTVAWLRGQREAFQAWSSGKAGLTAPEQISAYVDLIGSLSRSSRCLCPGGALAADWPSLPPPVRRELRSFWHDQQTWLESRFASLKRKGPLAACLSAREAARVLQATAIGALQMERGAPEPGGLISALRALAQALRGP